MRSWVHHKFQPDPDQPSFCRCGYSEDYFEHTNTVCNIEKHGMFDECVAALKDAREVLSRHVQPVAGGIIVRLERVISKAEGR